MKNKKLALALITATLAGCGTVTNVQHLGEDRYMVGATSGFRGHTKTKMAAIKRADQFCRSMGKQMFVLNTVSSGAYGITTVGGEVVFRCDPIAVVPASS